MQLRKQGACEPSSSSTCGAETLTRFVVPFPSPKTIQALHPPVLDEDNTRAPRHPLSPPLSPSPPPTTSPLPSTSGPNRRPILSAPGLPHRDYSITQSASYSGEKGDRRQKYYTSSTPPVETTSRSITRNDYQWRFRADRPACFTVPCSVPQPFRLTSYLRLPSMDAP